MLAPPPPSVLPTAVDAARPAPSLSPFAQRVVHLGFTNNMIFNENHENGAGGGVAASSDDANSADGTTAEAWGAIIGRCPSLQMVHINHVGMPQCEAETIAAVAGLGQQGQGVAGPRRASQEDGSKKAAAALRVLAKQNFVFSAPEQQPELEGQQPQGQGEAASTTASQVRKQQKGLAAAWQVVHDPGRVMEVAP